MQIVIEIPESIYDTIQSDEMISREQLAILQMRIMKGTPLPLEQEPCDDAISREKTMQIVRKWFDRDAAPSDLKDEIESLPPVTPAEKVGHWIPPQCDDGMSDPIYYQVRCSECGFDLDPQTFGEELKKYGADRFCPNCGAKMQEVEE